MSKSDVREHRTQRERIEATTGALLDAARELFAKDGYAATSLDAVVARAGVTKGALYHHFAGKQELFEAVFMREQHALAETVARAYSRKADPWEAFQAGARAFVDACLDPEVQRIFLLDAPVALGWEKIRELEENETFALVKSGLKRAMAAGRIDQRPVEPLATLLFGAMCEGVMSIPRATNQKAAATAVRAELRRLLVTLEASR